MGFFDRFSKHIPGGPVSAAKAMLDAFNIYKARNPYARRHEALRYAIETRYKILKLMNQDEIEACLKRSKYLGDLVCCAIEKENPAAVSEQFEDRTIKDLYNFFNKNAPEEIGSTLKAPMEMMLIEEGIINAKSKASWHGTSEATENGDYIEYYVIECFKCGKHNRIKKPLKAGLYKCGTCKILLMEMQL
jgi:hypothetical protein